MLRARGIFRGIAAVVAASCLAAVPAALPMGAFAATGVSSFSATGTNQAFTVPAGVTGIVAELFGARGGAGFVSPFTGPISSQPGADGGHATATLAVTPGQNLEVAVGGHGIDRGAGGFNGGGDGSVDPDSGCCGGGGGGGATDVRAGACATALTCVPADRVLVAGGGGGAGGGFDATTTGGAGGGTTGAAGADSTAPVASGGGGGTQGSPGAAGTGSAAGSPGDPVLGTGGQGGGGGGGGGGGWHGAGGGAANSTPDGAGGGGGSAGSTSTANPVHFLQGGNAAADGSADLLWLTWSPAAPVVGQPVTLTSHMPADSVGGHETFTEGATTLCASVLVAADGSASCTLVLPLGPHKVTGTMAALPAAAHCDGLTETSTVVVSPAATATALLSAPSTSTQGQSVSLVATVSTLSPGAGAPDGTVTFSDGGAVLCSAVPVAAGTNLATATCSTTALSVGTDYLLAAYSGSPSFMVSSATMTVTVNPIALPRAGAGPPPPVLPGAPAWVVPLVGLLIFSALGLGARRHN